jgi:adhesin transport system outer membrane protein
VVRWNLFNGGIDKARIGEAKARAMEAAEISANTQRIIEREVRTSWSAILAAEQRVPALSRQLELNRSTRNVYNQQFDAGQRRLLDLLDIQNETFVTEASLRTEELIGRYNTFRCWPPWAAWWRRSDWTCRARRRRRMRQVCSTVGTQRRGR